MGAEQADGLMDQENIPNINDIPISTDDHTTS